jgi:hypothetical protein
MLEEQMKNYFATINQFQHFLHKKGNWVELSFSSKVYRNIQT